MYYVCIQIIMIKARIRWCTCRVENILTLGKLLSLWFCFLLHSILFLISQTSYRTYKIISRYELARPVMGTIFLVYRYGNFPHPLRVSYGTVFTLTVESVLYSLHLANEGMERCSCWQRLPTSKVCHAQKDHVHLKLKS